MEHCADGFPAPIVEQFHVIEPIGAGRYASVYRGSSKSDLTTRVAIKVLHQPIDDVSRRRRFERECDALARLRGHPNIVQLLDAGIDVDGRAYIVTPLFGATLADRMQSRGSLDAGEVARLGAQIARALHGAHQVGVVHRGVKPDNVFIDDDGAALLGDFGIAGLVDGATVTGSVATSIAYAAPETLHRGETTVASDLYSLGVTLAYMISGVLPFGASTVRLSDGAAIGALIGRISRDDPCVLGPEAPAGLSGIITALMAKRPGDRPTDASLVAGVLDIAVAPALASRPAQRSRSASSLLLVGAVCSVLVLGAIMFLGCAEPGSDGAVRSAPTQQDICPPPTVDDISVGTSVATRAMTGCA
jgi:serine/threonine protein kinase